VIHRMSEPVYATYFTDPLCSWSWAFESSWRWLVSQLGNRLRYRYRMGGLLADWRRYQDPVNSVSRPTQMAPQWVEVEEQTGAPLNPELWHECPPASSYPACIAYKAAERTRLDFAEHYLRRLREAAMLEARDISNTEVLLALAEETSTSFLSEKALDFDEFLAAWESPEAEAAFREDLKEVRFMEIGRFPTLIFHRPGSRGLALTGYRPSAALYQGLAKFAPEMAPPEHMPEPLRIDDLPAYIARWKSVTLRELMENFALPQETIMGELQSLGLTSALANVKDPRAETSAHSSEAESLGWNDRNHAPSPFPRERSL
jgi:putative protein-disulfide isomerase